MNKAKRKRLECKGWKVGSADEFLGLTPAESQYAELKLALSKRLRKRREAQKLTQGEGVSEVLCKRVVV